MNKKQFLLFLTAGSISAIVNFLSFTLFFNYIGLDYKVSASLAYVLAVIVHFFGNRHLTFKSSDQQLSKQLKKYFVLLMINYLITLLTITTCVAVLHLPPLLGLAIAIGLTVGIGYTLSQRWIFKTSG